MLGICPNHKQVNRVRQRIQFSLLSAFIAMILMGFLICANIQGTYFQSIENDIQTALIDSYVHQGWPLEFQCFVKSTKQTLDFSYFCFIADLTCCVMLSISGGYIAEWMFYSTQNNSYVKWSRSIVGIVLLLLFYLNVRHFETHVMRYGSPCLTKFSQGWPGAYRQFHIANSENYFNVYFFTCDFMFAIIASGIAGYASECVFAYSKKRERENEP